MQRAAIDFGFRDRGKSLHPGSNPSWYIICDGRGMEEDH